MSATWTVTIEPVGREVECREDQPILDACLRAGVWLPHSCTHGTCATCKVDVLDGDVDHGEASSFALMDFERDEGKLLTCCARPRSDVTIEADLDVDEDLEMFPVEDFTGTVRVKETIARDTLRLVVELDRDMAFNAGQYMKFVVPATDTALACDRTWSIASPPPLPASWSSTSGSSPGSRDPWLGLQGPRGRLGGAPLRPLWAVRPAYR